MDDINVDYNALIDIDVVNNNNENFNVPNNNIDLEIIRNEFRKEYLFYEISCHLFDSFYNQRFEISINSQVDLNDQNSLNGLINNFFEEIILMRTFFSVLRLLILYCLFVLDNYKIEGPMLTMILFSLLIEACIISNFIFMKVYFCIINLFNNNNNQLRKFPKIILMFDILSNCIYLAWFIYAVYFLFYYPEYFDLAIDNSLYIVDYVLFCILIGFFQFSRIIFIFLVFFFFYPCLNFFMYNNYFNLYNKILTNHKLAKQLKPISFSEYIDKNKLKSEDVGMCIICTEEFKDNDPVIYLNCNNKHVFHENCIKQWIGKKAECPICRYDLTST